MNRQPLSFQPGAAAAMSQDRFTRRCTAGAALLALVATAATAAPSTVPWQAQPAAAPVDAASPAAAATRACAAADFQVVAGAAGAWHGFATQELRLTRTSSGGCRLDAAPAIELESPTGLRQAVAVALAEPAAVREPLALGTRDEVVLLVGTPGACDATMGPERRVTTRLRVAMPGGGDAVVDGVHVDTICGAARLLMLQALAHEETRSTLASLRAAVSEPVVAGNELRYVVTLSNPGARAVELSTCPVFTQTLSVEDRRSDSSWKLACAAAGGRIAANASVAFEMRAAIPAAMTGDGIKLAWTLQDGPSAGVVVPLR